MVKEALIWALCLTGIIFSWGILKEMLPITIKNYKSAVVLMFWGLFCSIYFLFRVLAYLYQVSTISYY